MRGVLFAAAVGLLGLAALPTEAKRRTADDRLALALAKVCANEAGFDHPRDCALIWQAVRSHGETSRARLRWLRRHSNCVLTSRPMSAFEASRNCRWSRHLRDSDARPRGWAGASWRAYQERWRDMGKWARAVVAGAVPAVGWPCPTDPHTWGGRDIDHEQAIAAGFKPVGCVDTLNEGYRW